ncbi:MULTISPECIES: DUF447 domain-containing protein [Methylosinus]|uniref:DUF447 domain-containing protein n=1 Tax=Methylosinus trichosporium (strain ATCC 35070 / NCIMB 11131 / UNIQEM 75 / OB3b) TaxID=595536 RepID=A0A2D2D2Q0_METT3|nr:MULTISPECIES: DUF447 domain-containing protein [Methylosinus]ATQ69139.1 DUF447 domain-containing protein [Methylosinus trichosporium OB3b]OBS53563.1 tetrahydromethanopterin synthesis protein [Methylosinus sp. 3S-1]
MPMIRECVVTTVGPTGQTHLAPLGLIEDGAFWIIAPFRPSTTLANLEAAPFATASFIDDVRIIAGCVCGRSDFPLEPVSGWSTPRLAAALSHAELEVARAEADPKRPRFFCRVKKIVSHAPFLGFNRAQAAVVEAAILATRLGMLPREKIDTELAYLQIAVDKTAGPVEREAWDLVTAKIKSYLQTQPD